MINGSQCNESLLIHLVDVVNKLTTQHTVDMKEMENKLKKHEEKHIQDIEKMERNHNESITKLNVDLNKSNSKGQTI